MIGHAQPVISHVRPTISHVELPQKNILIYSTNNWLYARLLACPLMRDIAGNSPPRYRSNFKTITKLHHYMYRYNYKISACRPLKPDAVTFILRENVCFHHSPAVSSVSKRTALFCLEFFILYCACLSRHPWPQYTMQK